jgi:hypothetical protein
MLRRVWLGSLVLFLLLAAVSPVLADTGSSALADKLGRLQAWIDTTDRPLLRQYLESVVGNADAADPASLRAVDYALKLAEDAHAGDAASMWTDTPFILYEVPALSPEKRLPDTLPEDGTVSDRITVLSAQDEYEAASFVLAPLADVDALTFTVHDLEGEGGTIPADAVDLRVVKTWYQGGTAWQSYFYDNTLDVLTPELLLHDENLILVDHETKHNFVRVDYPEGSRYVDISGSPPARFSSFTEPVEDSPVLLPISLKQGESKQMWVTTKVPAGTPAGLYTGTIDITADGAPAGQLTLMIHVLPFELPAPKTYYNPDKPFYAMIMHGSGLRTFLERTGGNTELAEKRLLNQYRNLVEHNVVNIPAYGLDVNNPSIWLRQLEILEEAGADLSVLFGLGSAFTSNEYYYRFTEYLAAKNAYEQNPTPENQAIMEEKYQLYYQTLIPAMDRLRAAFTIASEAVGHTNLYFDGWDEADWNRLLWQQPVWQFVIEELGAKIFATGNANHLNLEIKEQFLDWSGEPTREKADAWHAFGDDKIISNYAYPHSGPENPDLMRQRHGMWLYKANYDATYNYLWYYESQSVSPWGEYIDATYRAFNFVYPTQTDVIDTIAWEGFREGIDDIRYATKLVHLAREAIASGDPDRVQAGEQALTWLEETDERSTSADLIRHEMIYHIMKLIKLAEAE